MPFDLILKVILLVIDTLLWIELHPLRMMIKGSECINLFAYMLLTNLCAHDHRLFPVDIDLEIANGFVTSVRYQDDIFEPGMRQVMKNGFQTAGVRRIAWKCPVVYRHVSVKRVNDDFQCLCQRKVILVLSIADI